MWFLRMVGTFWDKGLSLQREVHEEIGSPGRRGKKVAASPRNFFELEGSSARKKRIITGGHRGGRRKTAK